MVNSALAVQDTPALASEYNNLRDDVLHATTGHRHSGAADGGTPLFSSLSDVNPDTGGAYANDTPYQAPRDLFVTLTVDTTLAAELYQGPANPPTILMAKAIVAVGGVMMPVKKGDWWKYKVTSGSGSSNLRVISIGG